MASANNFKSKNEDREDGLERKKQQILKDLYGDIKWEPVTESSHRPLLKGEVVEGPAHKDLESSFDLDCGSSLVSLDFGLVTPKTKWYSPPQRLEKEQIKEWSSPHRFVDKPDPKSSPGTWVPVKQPYEPPLGLGESLLIMYLFKCFRKRKGFGQNKVGRL